MTHTIDLLVKQRWTEDTKKDALFVFFIGVELGDVCTVVDV